jgi:hypothetical protein
VFVQLRNGRISIENSRIRAVKSCNFTLGETNSSHFQYVESLKDLLFISIRNLKLNDNILFVKLFSEICYRIKCDNDTNQVLPWYFFEIEESWKVNCFFFVKFLLRISVSSMIEEINPSKYLIRNIFNHTKNVLLVFFVIYLIIR